MGTIKVKAKHPAAKIGDMVGFYGERRYQNDVFEISDHPLTKEVPGPNPAEPVTVPIPGTVAHFSDNKRKKFPGWMEFVDPADDKKYREGGFNKDAKTVAAGAPPATPPAPAAPKPPAKGATGEKSVL